MKRALWLACVACMLCRQAGALTPVRISIDPQLTEIFIPPDFLGLSFEHE